MSDGREKSVAPEYMTEAYVTLIQYHRDTQATLSSMQQELKDIKQMLAWLTDVPPQRSVSEAVNSLLTPVKVAVEVKQTSKRFITVIFLVLLLLFFVGTISFIKHRLDLSIAPIMFP